MATKTIPDQAPVDSTVNLQTKVTEADLGRGSVQMGTGYTKADRVTGASGSIAMETNPIGVDKKTLPGLVRQ